MTDPVLITGGAGFIGSHLIDRLVNRNQPVVCLDNFDPYYSAALKRDNLAAAEQSGLVRFVKGDICDRNTLEDVLSGAGIRTVVHLAARPGVRPSLRDPDPYIRINVQGTLNVVRAATEHGLNRIIFASSSSVYGSVSQQAREDQDRLNPLSPYAASKVAGEAFCRAYASLSGITTVMLRFFTVYGPRQRPDMAISRFTDAIHSDREVTVFGSGESKRDYTFITDIVDGVDASITTPLNGLQVFNLGGSQPVQLLDLIRTLEQHLGKKARLRFEPLGTGEPELTFADVTAARKSLGFSPSVGIEQGTRRYVDWYLEKQNALAKAI